MYFKKLKTILSKKNEQYNFLWLFPSVKLTVKDAIWKKLLYMKLAADKMPNKTENPINKC